MALSISRRLLLGSVPTVGVLYAASTSASKRPVPKQMLARHRNLFNGDSCTYFYNPELWQPEGGPYSAKAIHRFVDTLADNGIDTFLINPNAQVAWYPSKKLQTYSLGIGEGIGNFSVGMALLPIHRRTRWMHSWIIQLQFYGLYQDLIDAGVDWLAETSKACRQRRISPWVSVRMNDMHGAGNPKGSHFNCELFKHDSTGCEVSRLIRKMG